jgi:ATP-binding cassette subfamily C protein
MTPPEPSTAPPRRAPAVRWSDLRPPATLPRQRLAGLLVLMVVSGASDGLAALALVPLLGLLQGGHGGTALAWTWRPEAPWSLPQAVLVFLATSAAAAGLQYLRALRTTSLQLGWIDDQRERTYAALLRADFRWLTRHRQSDLATTLTSEVGRIGVGLNALLGLAAAGLSALGYLVAACVLSPGMALVTMALAACGWRALAGLRAEAVTLGRHAGAANRTLHAQVHDNLASVRLTKLAGTEGLQARRFHAATQAVRQQQVDFVRSSGRSRVAMQLAGAVLLAGFVCAGMLGWTLAASQLMTLVVIAARLSGMLSSAQLNLHQWLNAVPALRELERLQAQCAAHAEPAHDRHVPSVQSPAEVALEAVVIRHSADAPATLDRLDLRLPAGSVTALTGASGVGKSTCADVLAGLLVPDAGRLLVDGRAIQGAGRLGWRQDVAYVAQEVLLVHDTVRRNLCWPGEPLPDEALRPALELAAAGFAWQLPQGLETVIGDRGARLSGGERQRLGLARALLHSPRLLIVDEATSALDADNEVHVVQSLAGLRGRVTMLVISHRPALLALADSRIELLDGCLRATPARAPA